MPAEILKKGERLAAYAGSGALIFIGLVGLIIECSKGMLSATHFSGYVLAAAFLVCGASAFLPVRLRDRGGWWSLFGMLCVAAAFMRVVFASETYMRGKQLAFPVAYISATAATCLMGLYCLFWGHLRRNKPDAKT